MRQDVAVGLMLVATGVIACGGDASVTMTGGWSGSLSGGTITITVTESEGVVTGSGSVSGQSGSLAVTVTGTNAYPSVSLTFHATGYEDMNFQGTFGADPNVLQGTLNGSGFTNDPLTFNRQTGATADLVAP